jgi:hypothetical protein
LIDVRVEGDEFVARHAEIEKIAQAVVQQNVVGFLPTVNLTL